LLQLTLKKSTAFPPGQLRWLQSSEGGDALEKKPEAPQHGTAGRLFSSKYVSPEKFFAATGRMQRRKTQPPQKLQTAVAIGERIEQHGNRNDI
jgi:hypothetical protein